MRGLPRFTGWLAALLAGVVTVPAASPPAAMPQDRQQPAFRSSASAIAVDVAVRDRSRRSITGLTAKDFQVFDNDVPQRVDDISYGRLPIDVTIALDISYSVTGALLDRLRRGVVDLMRDLSPQDRLKLVLFNMHVTRTTDFTTDPAVVERAIRGASAGGGTALLDALSVLLVSASAPDRRQLIVAFTDGSDSSSTTSPAVLTDVARRTRATLAFVLPAAVAAPLTIFTPGSGVSSSSVTSPVRPVKPGPFQVLFATLVTETGGSILPAGTGNLSETFRRVLGEFRSAYVLYYTAQGVEPQGYHTIRVQVNREGAQVQARRGYFGT